MNEENEDNLVGLKVEKNENLSKIKQEYCEIKSFMENLNNNLKVEVLVPIAENLAFFKGIIKHTNECTIFLGDDYYAQTVNKKAIQIIENRMKNIEKIQAENNIDIKNLPKEEYNTDQIQKNLKILEDGTYEICEEIDEFPQEEVSPITKPVQMSQDELEKIKKEREKLWEEKLQRMKILAEMEDDQEKSEKIDEKTINNQIECTIKSPKDIYNLMTSIKKDYEEINKVEKVNDVENRRNDRVTENNPNINKEIKSEGKNTKKGTKKKDIITTDLKLSSKGDDETKNEKRSLFFDENQEN